MEGKNSKWACLTIESDSSQRHTHKHAGYDVGSHNTTWALQAGTEQPSERCSVLAYVYGSTRRLTSYPALLWV